VRAHLVTLFTGSGLSREEGAEFFPVLVLVDDALGGPPLVSFHVVLVDENSDVIGVTVGFFSEGEG